MKTIIARFQELKKNVDEVEVEGEIVDANKIEGALRSVGIALRDEVTGQFRDLDDVFLELSSIWDTLDRNTQRYIATISAGSRQQSRFLAMMDNYKRTTELVNIANNSAGASASQFNKTLGSIEAKINKLSSSAEELVGTLFPNEFIRSILDIANNLFQVFNTIGDAGPIALAAFSAMAFKVVKNISNGVLMGLREASDAFDTFKNKLENEHPTVRVYLEYYNKDTGKKITDTSKVVDSEINDGSTGKKGWDENKKLVGHVTSIANTLGSIATTVSLIKSAQTTTSGATGGMIGSGVATIGSNVLSSFALSAASAHPIGAAIMAVLAAALPALGTDIGTLIGNSIDKSKGILSETFSKAMEEAAEKFQEEVNKASKEESELSSLITEYEKLTEVLSTGEGTLEQQERLKEVNEELVSLYPEAQAGYNAELSYRKANLELLKQELIERQKLQRESQLKLNIATNLTSADQKREEVDKKIKNLSVDFKNLERTLPMVYTKIDAISGFSYEQKEGLKKYIGEPYNIYQSDKNQQNYDNLFRRVEQLIELGILEEQKPLIASLKVFKNALEKEGEIYTPIFEQKEAANSEVKNTIKEINNQFVKSLIESSEAMGESALTQYSFLIQKYVNSSSQLDPTKIYDSKGNIDNNKLSEYEAELERHYNVIVDIFANLNNEEKKYVAQALSLKGLVDAETIEKLLQTGLNNIEKGSKIAESIFGIENGKLKNDKTLVEPYTQMYSDMVEHVQKLAKSGKYDEAALLAGQLSDFSNSDQDFNAFSMAYQNIIEAYGFNSDIAENFFASVSPHIKTYSSDLFEASTAVERLTEKLSKLEEYKDAIQSGALSAEQVKNLVSTYNLTLDNFQATAEGYKLVGTNYYELTSQAMEKTQQTYLQQIQTLGQIKSQLETQRNALGQERTTENAEEWDELTKKINDTTNSIILYGQAVASIKAPELRITSMQQAADSMDNLVASTEVLQSALDQYNEYGEISGTTFSKLIQANSDYISAIDVTNGKIILNKEELERLRQQEIQNYKTENDISIGKLKQQNDLIDLAIKQGKTALETARAEIATNTNTTKAIDEANKFIALSEEAMSTSVAEDTLNMAEASQNFQEISVTGANDVSDAIVNVANSYNDAARSIVNSIHSIILQWNNWKTAVAKDTVANAEKVSVTSGKLTATYTDSTKTQVKTLNNLTSNDKAVNWEDFKPGDEFDGEPYLRDLQNRIDALKKQQKLNNETIQELQALSDLYDKVSKTGGALGTGTSKNSSNNQKEYNLEFEKFYNILSKIADIQRELNELERQRKETSHYEELAKIDAKRLDLSEALIASRKVYLQQQKEEQKKIGIQLGTYKKYVTVLDGYLSVNRAAIEAIKDETLGETLKDLIKEYDDLSESIDKTNEEILKEKEYQEEIIKSAREYSQTLKDTLLDEVIETHEKEIQAVKDKYAAIKQEDTNYLNSLRKNLQKERDLRNREDEEEELLKLEKRLALLKRDTSGIYSSEILQLESEIADMRQSMADSQTDKMLEELEEQYNSEHQKMDEETQYLDNKHKENLESMQVYWDEVEEIITNGYDAILEYLKLTDEEFITGSKEEQEAWLEEWKKNINEALAYQQGLQNNFGRDEQKENSVEIPSTEEIPNNTQETVVKTTPEIGERVELKSGKKIYGSYDAQKGVNPYFGAGPYTVLRTKNGRVQVKYANAKTGGAIGWLNFKDLVGYSRGGLVTDTGPVMVHGSKQRPEAFLSADDTKLIMNLKNALASIAKRNDAFGTDITNAEKAGDTFYEIHIHVDELNNDYDVEQMMTAMERKIVNDARSRNVIAIKRSR